MKRETATNHGEHSAHSEKAVPCVKCFDQHFGYEENPETQDFRRPRSVRRV